MSNTPDQPGNLNASTEGAGAGAQASSGEAPAAAPVRTTPSYARPASATVAPKAVKGDDASLASIIDTIEAIIIALILALTFRAFIIEAFVIPTGSMAPTLLGAHFNVTCPQCGYSFTRDANLDWQLSARDKAIVQLKRGELVSNTSVPCDGSPEPGSLFCGNCQYIIPYNLLPQYLGLAKEIRDGRPTKNQVRDVPFAWANNGDRILVLKYLYSAMEPSRFDVIVFKEPMHARDNYIKRLIGLPGETIEIIGGDVFAGPRGKTDAADRVIQRKPVHIQKDLWQLVYDNDFYPRDEGPVAAVSPYARRSLAERESQLPSYFREWHNPWKGAGATASGWEKPGARTIDGRPFQTVGGPVIRYGGSGRGTLVFNPERRDPYTYNILAYNNDIHDLYNGEGGTLLPTGDLRLETTWTPAAAGSESFTMTVGLPRNLFRAVWTVDGMELLHFDPETERFDSVKKVAAGDLPKLEAGKAYNIAFNNVDRSAQVFIDGELVLSHDTHWTAVDAMKEDAWFQSLKGSGLSAVAPRIEIEVGGACTLGHLKLWRDLYYTQTEQKAKSPRYPGAAAAGNPLTLGEDEFFALGDNSRRSHDGRTWNEVFPALDDLGTARGIVPRRYLLGKAVFVYWPAGFRFSDRFNAWPLVPNTGDMRFIR